MARKQSKMEIEPTVELRGSPLLELLETRRLLSAATVSSVLVAEPSVTDAAVTHSTVVGYTAAEIKTAYGISGSGSGQTIAIVDAYSDPNITSDLASFDAAMGLSSASLTIESQTGSTTALPTANAGWALETSLDVEWAHAVAPSAKILLVEASTDSLANLLAAVNLARSSAGVSVVSMSWGSSEFSSESSYDSYFTTPSGHGDVAFVASSGDDGYAEWPASSVDVVSVGGSALSIGSSGSYQSESAWADSGGGYSRYEGEPSYQQVVQSSGYRTTPDVAYDANPSTGVAVYDSDSYDGASGWFDIGGTSAGAPQWASLIAIADQSRAAASKTLLTSAGVLNALYSTYTSSSIYSADFHDITSGGGDGKSASIGYDLLTGLGTPRGSGVIATLEAFTGSQTATAATISTRPAPAPGGFGGNRNDVVAPSAASVTLQSAASDASAFGPSFSLKPFLEMLDQSARTLDGVETSLTANLASLAASTPVGVEPEAAAAGSTSLLQGSEFTAFAAPASAAPMGVGAEGGFAGSAGLMSASSAGWGGEMASIFGTAGGTTAAVLESSILHGSLEAGSQVLHALTDPSLRSFETAAAAAVMGAAFLWWWTEPQREARRPGFAPGHSDVFCRKLIEIGIRG